MKTIEKNREHKTLRKIMKNLRKCKKNHEILDENMTFF